MPVWPKSLYTFRASVQTGRAASRLRGKSNAAEAQGRALAGLTRRLAATEFWRQAGVEAGMSYESFRARVAPRTYEQIAPAIERMKSGEADVLWPRRCTLFGLTSGTVGQPKWIPMTEEMLGHFRTAGREAMLYYTSRVGNAGVFTGRHLLMGGPSELVPVPGAAANDIFCAAASGIAALNLPAWVEKHLFEPGAEIARLPESLTKLDAT